MGALQLVGHCPLTRRRDHCSQMITINFPEDKAFAVKWWLSISQRTGPLQSDGVYQFSRRHDLCSQVATNHFAKDNSQMVTRGCGICGKTFTIQLPEDGSDCDYPFSRGRDLCSQMVTIHFLEDGTFAVRWRLFFSQRTNPWLSIFQRTEPLQSDDDHPFPRGRGICSQTVTIHLPEDGAFVVTLHLLEDGTIADVDCCPEDGSFAVRWWLSIFQRTAPLQSGCDYPFPGGRGLCNKMVTIHLPAHGTIAVR